MQSQLAVTSPPSHLIDNPPIKEVIITNNRLLTNLAYSIIKTEATKYIKEYTAKVTVESKKII